MRTTRRKLLLLIIGDATVIFGGQVATLWLLQDWYHNLLIPITSISAFIGVGLVSGFYKTSISHVGIGAVKHAIWGMLISGLIIYLLDKSPQLAFFSSLITLAGVIGYRVVTREMLYKKRHSRAIKTLVYGAGSAGVQFVTASMQGETHDVVGYIDDDDTLCGTSIHGRLVQPSKYIEQIVAKFKVELVVLALPSATKLERKRIIESLISIPIRVVTIPTFNDLIQSKQKITQTEDLSIEDLLGREPVPPMQQFVTARTSRKVCLVTGAGGSIGSELCRRIAACGPSRLILIDFSEPALFAIEQDLLNLGYTNISCYLGSANGSDFIDRVFSEHKIDCVFHAAAYKHVPMVEANPMAGLINNVETTKVVLNAALSNKSESFTLISTDKAVRPTNIMGATKRLAEMACQIKANAKSGVTTISIVRFGNVLGSSGSVIPTFQQQIRQGGPVTLTHPDITRYFMTIPEAAELVIQAAGMAETGDMFLLDMGAPVKISELAHRMIQLSGKTVRAQDSVTSENSIEIKITGLRPGEKLYEELLVDAQAQETEHPKIMRAREQHITSEEFDAGLTDLLFLISQGDTDGFRRVLSKLVVGYKPVFEHHID